MSVAGSTRDMAELMLRSSTPAANEKVLMYLERLTPGEPVPVGDEWEETESERNRRSAHIALQNEADKSQPAPEQYDLWDQNQDAAPSFKAPSQLAPSAKHSHARKESLGGGAAQSVASSYGKVQEQPRIISAAQAHWSTWQPTWKQSGGSQAPSAAGGLGVPTQSNQLLTPGAHKIALPPSVVSGSQYDINLESPTTEGARSKVPSRAPSYQPPPTTAAPVARSRAGSKAAPPVAKSAKSRYSEKAGTVYPPLPASVQGEGNLWSPMSQQSQLPPNSPPRQFSRPPSVSPSDSQSNAKFRQTAASPRVAPRSVLASEAPLRTFGHVGGAPPTMEQMLDAVRPSSPAKSKAGSVARSKVPSSLASLVNSEANSKGIIRAPSAVPSRVPTQAPAQAPPAPSVAPSRAPTKAPTAVPTEPASAPPRPATPGDDQLEPSEQKMVQDALDSRRTSYAAPSILEPEIANSHFHDMDLCILLHQMDDYNTHEVVKKALRKAVRQRVKKLGLKYDSESIRQYRKSFHDHDPSIHLDGNYNPEANRWPTDMPDWARMLMDGLSLVHERFDGLDDQIRHMSPAQAHLEQARQALTISDIETNPYAEHNTPRGQNAHLEGGATSTGAGSMYPVTDDQYGASVMTQSDGHHDEQYDEDEELLDNDGRSTPMQHSRSQNGSVRTPVRATATEDKDSPGQQFLEEELYKLRIKAGGSQSGQSHKTWEVGEVGDEYDDEAREDDQEFNEIPEFDDAPEPPPKETSVASLEVVQPWQRVHQRLLSWALIWPLSELDQALNSTTRGFQVDEVALTIWSMQAYKRYVRSKMTDAPAGQPDRLFVPPNMADAISTAVFNGRHGDACGMLLDLWRPFGFETCPRLIVVLAKHRSDPNHWVVHRFSVPEGALTTYDSYADRTLPDGRPLGWWFAIRVAWQGAVKRSTDHLMQKMVRLHRPMQLGIDNSVAAAGIWRNVLMGSRAERSVDLERLRDLINTEVKNLRTRKIQGKLSVNPASGHGWAEEGQWAS